MYLVTEKTFPFSDKRPYILKKGQCNAVGMCGVEAACHPFPNNTYVCLCPHDSQPPTIDGNDCPRHTGKTLFIFIIIIYIYLDCFYFYLIHLFPVEPVPATITGIQPPPPPKTIENNINSTTEPASWVNYKNKVI